MLIRPTRLPRARGSLGSNGRALRRNVQGHFGGSMETMSASGLGDSSVIHFPQISTTSRSSNQVHSPLV